MQPYRKDTFVRAKLVSPELCLFGDFQSSTGTVRILANFVHRLIEATQPCDEQAAQVQSEPFGLLSIIPAAMNLSERL
jgi:hypothetical protein